MIFSCTYYICIIIIKRLSLHSIITFIYSKMMIQLKLLEKVIDLTRPTENNPTVSRAEKKPDTEKLPDTGILSSRYLVLSRLICCSPLSMLLCAFNVGRTTPSSRTVLIVAESFLPLLRTQFVSCQVEEQYVYGHGWSTDFMPDLKEYK